MRIFLDLDGVLINFVKSAADIFDLDYDELLSVWPSGEYDMAKVLGISEDAFFQVINAAGEGFWANLTLYPYAMDFYHYCKDLAPTYILTRPTTHSSSLSGKLQWMQKHFGSNFTDYAITHKKELCAGPNTILIDDHTVNCTKFVDAGGSAIIWPAHNNIRFDQADECVELAKKELNEWRLKI